MQHAQQGTIHARLLLYLTAGSLPGSLLGVASTALLLSAFGAAAELILVRVLAVTLIIAGLLASIRNRASANHPKDSLQSALSARRRIGAALLGLGVGFTVGLTSVGSGTIILVALLAFFAIPASIIVGTTVANAAILQGLAGLGYLTLGSVSPEILASLLVGSLPAAIIGSKLAKWVPEVWLRRVIIGAVLISGLALLVRYGF